MLANNLQKNGARRALAFDTCGLKEDENPDQRTERRKGFEKPTPHRGQQLKLLNVPLQRHRCRRFVVKRKGIHEECMAACSECPQSRSQDIPSSAALRTHVVGCGMNHTGIDFGSRRDLLKHGMAFGVQESET